jgi:protein ImuB
VKLIVCVRLKSWSIDLLKRRLRWRGRREAESRIQNQQSKIPLVLTRTVASRQLVVAACEVAMSRRIVPGMTLPEARALDASLLDFPHDPACDTRARVALARWLIRFSPVVSILQDDAIAIDATGSGRLFGDDSAIVRLVADSLRKLGIRAAVAAGPNPGAAYAMTFGAEGQKDESCRFQTNQKELQSQIAPVGRSIEDRKTKLENSLAPLPVAALRLSPGIVDALRQLGIVTIGHLMQLPRASLPARFGPELLWRLDQAMGRIGEPLVAVELPARIVQQIDFETPTQSREMIEYILRRMIERIVADLARRGCGARQMRIELRLAGEMPLVRTIRLSRPSRRRSNLFNLIRCALETWEPSPSGDGFTGVRLSIPVFERIHDEQIDLVGGDTEAVAGEMAQLVERLAVRLGENAIARPCLVECYLPERAWKEVHEIDPAAKPSLNPGDAGHPSPPRPLQLLPMPREVRVIVSPSYDLEGQPIAFAPERDMTRIVRAAGPERIAGLWWEGHHRTRDYFHVEDETGRQFWLFRVRENNRWFLHGTFE